MARRQRTRSDCKDIGGDLSLNKLTLGQNRTTLAHIRSRSLAVERRQATCGLHAAVSDASGDALLYQDASRHCWICGLEVESIPKILTLYHKRNSVSKFSIP